MSLIDRRKFLAGTAATVAAPAVAAAQTAGDLDFVVVGAGAAGIAAARRIAAANRRCVVVEAADRIGGRCSTDTTLFGMPFDRGAHWLYTPDINPVAALGTRAGLDLYPAPPGQRIRIGRRNAREGEVEDFLSGLVRTNRAIADAARGKTDVSCAQALPKDLIDWQSTIEFVLGPLACAKDLSEVSAADFAKSAERDVAAFCRQGLGTLMAKLAEGLTVQLANPVKNIQAWTRNRVEVATAKGTLTARAAIVTVSTGVLAANRIRFDPELPKRHLDAIGRLKLGSYDHIVVELADNPLGLQRDDLVYEKSSGPRTAAMLANIGGTGLCMIDVGGNFGRELAAQGEPAMVAFALDWLSGLYGTEIRKAVRRTAATRWNEEPFVLGAFSSASPGGQGARTALMEPFRDRIWFAGEAVHETLWGTVGGAWQSGERAAEAAMRKFGFITAPREPREPRTAPPRKRAPRRPPASAGPSFFPWNR
jgi:monoamine oxidase